MIGAALTGIVMAWGWMDTYGDPFQALCAGLIITVALGLFADAAS